MEEENYFIIVHTNGSFNFINFTTDIIKIINGYSLKCVESQFNTIIMSIHTCNLPKR